jgi:A/G-specific adenine glycosylase
MLTRAAFQKKVWAYYRRAGRHDLPWRKTTDPYHILVSEIMLQQTQVERVLPKYEAFIQKYPTYLTLAQAPLAGVLSLWVGLGYNRRAKFLKNAAEAIVLRGGFPKAEADLRTLPGVGPYTASAICAFAYNAPTVMIETNIRTVFVDSFFLEAKEKIADTLILEKVADTLPKGKSREWYAALMDYGAYLKKVQGSNNHLSKGYVKQKAFNGSNRQIRGRIIKMLTESPVPISGKKLMTIFETDANRVSEQLTKLEQEQLVEKTKKGYRIAT